MQAKASLTSAMPRSDMDVRLQIQLSLYSSLMNEIISVELTFRSRPRGQLCPPAGSGVCLVPHRESVNSAEPHTVRWHLCTCRAPSKR